MSFFLFIFDYIVDATYTSGNPKDFEVVAQTNYHKEPGQIVQVKRFIRHREYEFTDHKWRDLFFVYVKNDIG